MKKNNWSLVKILICYVGTILLVPLIVSLPFFNVLIGLYLHPLGNLKSAFISLFGASMGSFIAIIGAVWIQDRNKKIHDINEVKKSALIIYYDFKIAFEDLLPFYRKWWNMAH